jgi:hypothetical protein
VSRRQLTTDQVRALRAHYSRDLCTCGHLRQLHYTALTASTGACGQTDCGCHAYAWHPQEGDVPWF